MSAHQAVPPRVRHGITLAELLAGTIAFAIACLFLPPIRPTSLRFGALGFLTWHSVLCMTVVPLAMSDVRYGRASRLGRTGQLALLLAAVSAIALRLLLPGALERCDDGEGAFAHEPGAALIWMTFYSVGIVAIVVAMVPAIDGSRARRGWGLLPLIVALPLPLWFRVLGNAILK